jgi:class 3 adenylate cyclase/tetratricopeptide (TPR) repeat protein
VPNREESEAVTVVLCDVADSTHLAEQLGPEVLRAIVSRHSREMRAVLESHGGTIESAAGDAVMAVLDDPLKGLSAAVEMGAALEKLNAELQSDWGVRISTRVGVSTAETVAEAVNLATRIEQTATFGEVWVDERTAELAGADAELEHAGLVRVSGKGKAVRASRLVRMVVDEPEPPAPPPPPPPPPDPRLEALEEAFEQTVSERTCHVVSLADPALVDRLGDRARILRGRCLPGGLSPFAPVAEALGDLAEVPDPALPEERFAAIHRLLERAVESEPVVVLFDDMQFAAQSFLDLIDYLPRLPSEAPVLVACFTSEEVEDGPLPEADELVAAARDASASGDLTTATDLFERAVALSELDDPRHVALLSELGEVLCELGELDEAEDILSDAVEEARAAGDRRIEMRAVLARAYTRLFMDEVNAAERLRVAAERAVAVFAGMGDAAGLARAWDALSLVHSGACRWSDAADACRQGIEHARAAGERRLELRALAGLAYALYFGPTPVDDALSTVEEEILPHMQGFPVAEATVLGVLGGLHGMQGRFDDARELHARGREIFAQLGPALPTTEGALNAADTELLADDPEQAELLLRGAYAALEGADETAIRSSVAAALAQALAARGRDDEALALTEESERATAADDVQPQVTWRAVRAAVLARRGEREEAERLAGEAVEIAREADDPGLLAMALLAAGEDDEAAELYDAKGNAAALRALSRSGGP